MSDSASPSWCMDKPTAAAKPAMTDRVFHKTVIRYEVISEEPLGEVSLEDIYNLCTDGPCSGRFLGVKETELNGRQAVRALFKQGSGSEFFRLDARGADADCLATEPT